MPENCAKREATASGCLAAILNHDDLHYMAGDYEERANDDQRKLEQMMLYGQIASCRWKFLLDYFGEETNWNRCGHCDNCLVPPRDAHWRRAIMMPF